MAGSLHEERPWSNQERVSRKHDEVVKVCFVAHSAYRAMSGIGAGHIGGVERQISLTAQWLANHGHCVTVIVWDEGQPDELMVKGVRVLKVCREDAGIPGVRFFVPRWSSLCGALKQANADIYYQNCAEYVTGQVVLWARIHRRKFVYSIASDPGCDPQLKILGSIRERVLYRLGLKMADAVIAQTNHQRHELRQGFNVDAAVLPMPCENPETHEQDSIQKKGMNVLWVGRIDRIKRAEIILRVARDCPDVEFDIVGPPGTDRRYVADIQDRAKQLDNVNWHGAVDFADMSSYYRQATLFCCTSEFEGFPNTFLEAWSYGIPVVSTVDPDDVIARYNLGVAVSGPERIRETLQELVGDSERIAGMATAARQYFSRKHQKNTAMPRFESLLEAVLQGRHE